MPKKPAKNKIVGKMEREELVRKFEKRQRKLEKELQEIKIVLTVLNIQASVEEAKGE